jgi:hypothetical protein
MTYFCSSIFFNNRIYLFDLISVGFVLRTVKSFNKQFSSMEFDPVQSEFRLSAGLIVECKFCWE